MRISIKVRWVAYLGAVLLVLFFIGWTGHHSWKTIQQLGDASAWQVRWRPPAAQLQKKVLELKCLALACRFRWNVGSRQQLDEACQAFDLWLKGFWVAIQPGSLAGVPSAGRWADVSREYQEILFLFQFDKPPTASAPEAAFERLARVLEQFLEIGQELELQQTQFLNVHLLWSRQSLGKLHAQTWGLLGLLLVLGAIVALMVYRGMIAPLRTRLVESCQVAERQEKLAALGMLAAGVAHEIRNPLTAIKARLFTLSKNLKSGSREQLDARVIDQELNRLERIVRNFLLFSRPAEPSFEMKAAADPMREIQWFMGPQLSKAGIDLRLESPLPTPVRIDPEQIKQVLVNLVQNAAESMERNGTITLRCRERVTRLGGKMTNAVVLEVADTGKGIPLEIQDRLFDPFFTTKEGGSGLGLAISVGILEKHGGALEYQTSLGKGTTFGVVLPIAAHAEAA